MASAATEPRAPGLLDVPFAWGRIARQLGTPKNRFRFGLACKEIYFNLLPTELYRTVVATPQTAASLVGALHRWRPEVRVIENCESTIGVLIDACGMAIFDTLSRCGGKLLDLSFKCTTLPRLDDFTSLSSLSFDVERGAAPQFPLLLPPTLLREILKCSRPPISLSHVAHATQLTTLFMTETYTYAAPSGLWPSLDPLSSLVGLQNLSLEMRSQKSGDMLSCLTNLTCLRLFLDKAPILEGLGRCARLRELDMLVSPRLEGTHELAGLTGLTALYLTARTEEPTEVPRQLAGMTGLQVLKLEAYTLMDEGGNMRAGFAHLPSSLTYLHLKHLGLEAPPAELASLTRLAHLRINTHPLQGGLLHLQHLPSSLTALAFVNARSESVLPELEALPALLDLVIVSDNLPAYNWANLPTTLTGLTLEDCDPSFDDFEFTVLPSELTRLTQLRALELSCGGVPAAAFLSRLPPSVTTLHIPCARTSTMANELGPRLGLERQARKVPGVSRSFFKRECHSMCLVL